MITSKANAGTGLLAIFCDLDPRWHREFRAWLRDDMFPARMKIGFRAAASYDLVQDAVDRHGIPEPFATVYETVSTGDLYGAPYQALRANRDQRDRDFHARFLKPARYTLCWVGPEISQTDKGGFSPVAVIDRLDLPEATVQEFNIWYMTEYLQRISRVPGILRVRRYLAMEGSPRHVMVHEFDGQAPLSDGNWTAARADLSKTVIPNGSRVTGTYSSVLSAAG
ncbi:MAG: hypothetical protein AB1558_00695 [Thermodesulfobacteriota bacterium]